jgi:hypothetical protein
VAFDVHRFERPGEGTGPDRRARMAGRQVISLSGDGGLSMLMGDLLTAVQEKIPIKIAVFNNGSLGFVELEMKVEGLLDAYTNLENPDFCSCGRGDWLRREARRPCRGPRLRQGRSCWPRRRCLGARDREFVGVRYLVGAGWQTSISR